MKTNLLAAIVVMMAALGQSDRAGYDTLNEAIKSGNLARVDAFINKSNVNKKTLERWTPLGMASQYGTPEIVSSFINKGAKIDDIDIGGHTALWHAVHANKVEITKLLLENKANTNKFAPDDNRTILMEAAAGGATEVAKLLIDYGADVKAKDKNGKTALDYAKSAKNKQPELIKLLEEKMKASK